jgi:anionic cell wall polymer biosynthesis LytR-Cps2A-Psr (LCP) family protein
MEAKIMNFWQNIRSYIGLFFLVSIMIACGGNWQVERVRPPQVEPVVTKSVVVNEPTTSLDNVSIIPIEMRPIIKFIHMSRDVLISFRRTTSITKSLAPDASPYLTNVDEPVILEQPSIFINHEINQEPVLETKKVTTTVNIKPVFQDTSLVSADSVGTPTQTLRIDSSQDFVPPAAEPITYTQITTNRINILLMGADKRPNDNAGRSDTIIMVTINQDTKTVGMLSIPRDLWVMIPGYGMNRINAAYLLGERATPNGGGVALMQRTIEHNFGIRADYYAQINFDGFEQVVDILGGIEIDVPELHDTARFYGFTPRYINKASHYSFIPASVVDATGKPKGNAWEIVTQTLIITDEIQLAQLNYEPGYRMVYLEPGRHFIDGETALQYARSRASVTADFARMQRQQAVLLAIRERSLQTNALTRIPELWVTLDEAIQTNLTLMEILKLATLVQEIQPENIRTVSIDYTMTTDYRTDKGARVLLPLYDRIEQLVKEMFE